MATWKSVKTVKFDRDMGFDYAKSELTWSYQTVSDYLTIYQKNGEYSTYNGVQPESESVKHFSKNEALALLETLLDWANVYEGEDTIKEMLERINKDDK